MVADLVNQQANSHEVHLLIINRNIASSMLNRIDNKVHIHRIGRKKGKLAPLRIIWLNLILHNLRPHVIHCHFHNQIKILFFFKRRKLHLTVHDKNRPLDNIYKFPTVFSISRSVQEDIKKRGGIESTVIYNGIRMDPIRVKNIRKSGVFRIVQVSRLLHEKKGQDVLIRAMHLLQHYQMDEKIELNFIGTGSSEAYLKHLVEDLKLGHLVHFLGYRERNYINHHLRDFDLLVQPSRYEGFGITVIEAMAACVPVLVSDIDGPMEIVDGGNYGHYFQSENAKQCAEGIIEIMKHTLNGGIAHKMQGVREYVLENFSIERTSTCYLDHYKFK